MDVIRNVLARYEHTREEDMSLEEYLEQCRRDPLVYATAAERMLAAVEAAGATPAITAIVKGVPSFGLEPADLERFLARDGVRKVSSRDLGITVAQQADGATTVAGTLAMCTLAGIEVFATGGIGGVHRNAPYDESADLVALSHTPVIVVCAGAKSILDLPATLERLETLGVPVIAYGQDDLPAFWSRQSGLKAPLRMDSPAEIAAAHRMRGALGLPGGQLVANPIPAEAEIPSDVLAPHIAKALSEAEAQGIAAKAVTPFLLQRIFELTHGASLEANIALVLNNARLGAKIASEMAKA